MSETVDPLAADAPIHHLLSLKHNPMTKDMTTEQLTELVKRCRTLAASPQTLTSALQKESGRKRPLSPEAAKRKAILDSI